LFDDPVHPYTRLLIGSVPRLVDADGLVQADVAEAVGDSAIREELAMSAASAGTSPCRYYERCPSVVAGCGAEPSLVTDPRDADRSAACVHVAERAPGAVA
jgi:ABC-type dipeptide/oligopeptide/nickel transport system ATPase component